MTLPWIIDKLEDEPPVLHGCCRERERERERESNDVDGDNTYFHADVTLKILICRKSEKVRMC